jgi:acyl-CoA thioester hydrolase
MAHALRLKIYYEDTDAGGVVYYANYLRYMERARTEFLSEKGISVAGYHREGLFFVVTHVDIRYRAPARLGDTIEITTEVGELKKVSITLKHRAVRDSAILAEATVTLALIDREGKPRRLPEGFRGLMRD